MCFSSSGTITYNRDYYGTITPAFHPPLTPPLLENLTVILTHWCDNERGQVANLVKYHNDAKPLKNLKIVMETGCSRYEMDCDADGEFIKEVFLPLKGCLEATKLILVKFGKLEEGVREVLRRKEDEEEVGK